jgi:hypothetical protein
LERDIAFRPNSPEIGKFPGKNSVFFPAEFGGNRPIPPEFDCVENLAILCFFRLIFFPFNFRPKTEFGRNFSWPSHGIRPKNYKNKLMI